MPVFDDDPFGGIKTDKRSDTPPPREVSNFHNESDVDATVFAHHHTLGIKHNQASPGDHIHNGRDSKAITSISFGGREFRADSNGLWADSVFGLRTKTKDNQTTRFPIVVGGLNVTAGTTNTTSATTTLVNVNGLSFTADIYGGRLYCVEFKLRIASTVATDRINLGVRLDSTDVGPVGFFISNSTAFVDGYARCWFINPLADGVRTIRATICRGSGTGTVTGRVEAGVQIVAQEWGEGAIVSNF